MASPGPCTLLLLVLSAITTSLAQNERLVFTGATRTSSDAYVYRVKINQNYVLNQTILNANCSNMHSPSSQVNYNLHYAGKQFFAIHPKTGVVFLKVDGLDFPRDDNYSATIHCQSDGVQEPITATLQVSFTNQNEFSPVFSHSRSFRFSFREDYNINTGMNILDLNATDMDRGKCGVIVYSIQAGNRMKTFRIDRSSGVLSFARSLDSDVVSDYTLQVIAGPANQAQCRSPASPTTSVVIIIHVEDINDTPPHFDQQVYGASVLENTQPQNFLQISCSDPDSSSHLIYLIQNVHFFPFHIDQRTGNLSVRSSLDYEERELYTLNVTCRDVQGTSQVDYATVIVNVLPVNEFRPEIEHQGGSVTVINDNTPPGTLVLSPMQDSDALLTFRVEDRDRGVDHGDVSYTLSSIDEFASNHFYLNRSSGELILAKQFDNTQCQQEGRSIELRDAHIQITVCDISDSSLCPTLSLQVFIIPGECIPSFSQNHTRVYINESAPIGTSFASIPCTVDSADNKTVTILSENDPEVIQTFALSPKEDSLTLLKSLDYERKENYSFYLLCVNSYRSRAIAEVDVVVTPDNDNPPLFDSPLYVINVTLPILSVPHKVGEIEARDKDRGVGGNITYALTDVNKYFSVDSNGTILIHDIPPQSSNKNTAFVLEIRASDGKFSAQTKALVLLSNNHAVQAQQSSEEDDKSTTTIALITALVFIGVLLLLSCILVVYLYVRGRRKQTQADQQKPQIQDFSGETAACLAYNVTSLTAEPVFHSSPYNEIKGEEGPEYAQLHYTRQRTLSEPRSPTPQPYACPVPIEEIQYERRVQTSEMGGYVPMQTANVTKAGQDKDGEEETALEFGGMVASNGEITSWRNAPVQTVRMTQAQEDETAEEETAVEFGGVGDGAITSWRVDEAEKEGERREGQEAAEDDEGSCSFLEHGPPKSIRDNNNIYEHVQ